MPVHRPQIREDRAFQVAFYRLNDVGCSFLALAFASWLGQPLFREQFLVASLASALLYLFFSNITGNYRRWRGSTYIREIACAWGTWWATLIGAICLGALFQYGSGLTRFSFGVWGLATCALLAGSRGLLRGATSWLYARGFNAKGFAIVGINDLGIQLARNIEETPQLGLNLVGFYDDRPRNRTPELPDEFGGRLGDMDELVEQTKQGAIHTIFITFPMRAEDRIRRLLDLLADTTASVYVVPDFFVFELLHSRWSNIQGLPVVSIFEHPFYGVDGMLKRTVDVVIGTAMLLLVALPMGIIALAVKWTSPGPILFRQKRYGLDGREIPVWKFRTMRVCEDGQSVVQATQQDPRVTPLGAFLRRTSLDELPQLFNVLAGDMSLVGPRPHATVHNESYRKQIRGYMLRHKVKPGITGLAQVEGWRGETDTLEKMQKRIECDHRYIRDWNLWLDIQILFRTLWVVLAAKNAY